MHRPRVRPVTPDDYHDFARFFVELGTGEPVPSPAKWESELVRNAIFLERDGRPVAYNLSTPMGELGYVMHVVVAPEARGRGVGRALMAHVAGRLRAAGCRRWCLNVMLGNEPALRLYRRFGLAQAYRSTSLRLPWALLDRFERPAGVTSVTLDPDDDARVERRFRLPAGTLAMRRGRAGRVVLVLEDGANRPGDLGVAVFDPAFPGAFPFRVARPDLVGALLRALHAHARAEHDFTLLLVEDDEPLDRALRAAGAEVRFELLHMEGELPLDGPEGEA